MRHPICVATVTLVCSAATLSAQEPGTVEIGGFGQFTRFDENTTLTQDGSWGAGGLLGVFLARNLALEGAWSRTWTEDASAPAVDGTWDAWRGRLVYGLPLSYWVQPLLGIGYVHNVYSDAVNGEDDGVTGLLGLKVYFSHRVALRSDAQLDYVWAPFNEGSTVGSNTVAEHMNWTVSAGLSIDIGRGRARDTDRDGVRDRDDACARTPVGVSVDSRGCRVDTDGDGVFDENDRCTGTRSGVRVDASGCRVDTDGDGVFDEDDRCTGTPSGVRVDSSGCRVDTDGDGVFDEDDRCTGTPSGVEVDSTGCRVDSDGDGVFDEDDRCTATEPGVAVDASGCPQLFEPETTVVVLEGVNFEVGSAILTAAALRVLDRVAASLIASPDLRVRVSGHTDSTGPRAFNVRLSQERAESVMRYLIAQGVAADRLVAVGYGPDRPVADNSTAANRAMNRRVELERIN
jgi:outer membrane protein OmpA-like peptidoglycan-associated protein